MERITRLTTDPKLILAVSRDDTESRVLFTVWIKSAKQRGEKMMKSRKSVQQRYPVDASSSSAKVRKDLRNDKTPDSLHDRLNLAKYVDQVC